MTKIYNFLMYKKLIYVYITILISIISLTSILSLMNWNVISKMILPFSLFISLPITGIIWITRQAETFFRKANSIEEQLNNLTTLDQLINLYNNQFIPLSITSFDKNGTANITTKGNGSIILQKLLYTLTIHIKQLNLTVHYNQDVNTSWFIAHTDKNNTILYYKNNKNDIQLTNNISKHIQNMVNFYINK